MEDNFIHFLNIVESGFLLKRNILDEESTNIIGKMGSFIYRHMGVVVKVYERSLQGIIVFHYSEKNKVWSCILENMEDFMGNNVDFEYFRAEAPDNILQRARDMVKYSEKDLSYSPFNNCEDRAYLLLKGMKSSPQRDVTFLIIIGFVMLFGIFLV